MEHTARWTPAAATPIDELALRRALRTSGRGSIGYSVPCAAAPSLTGVASSGPMLEAVMRRREAREEAERAARSARAA